MGEEGGARGGGGGDGGEVGVGGVKGEMRRRVVDVGGVVRGVGVVIAVLGASAVPVAQQTIEEPTWTDSGGEGERGK